MTDEEVICTYMEPNPEILIPAREAFKHMGFAQSPLGWWVYSWLAESHSTKPRHMTLDCLFEVEAEVAKKCKNGGSDEWWVWNKYNDLITRIPICWHAGIEDRIRLLAEVLRREVLSRRSM